MAARVLFSSASAMSFDETRNTATRTTAPTTQTNPMRQSSKHNPMTTTAALVMLATTGVKKCALVLPTNIVPLTAIWETSPVRRRVNQPRGRVSR